MLGIILNLQLLEIYVNVGECLPVGVKFLVISVKPVSRLVAYCM